MNDKKISIVVPIYNAEQTLDKCISSLVNQTYKNIEIILVDDGSKDSSPDICKKWKNIDDRIIYISKTNGGVSSARNAGINTANGDYVGFVDSDDYADENLFEYLLTLSQDYNADIARVSYYIVNMDSTLVKGEPDNEIRVYSKNDMVNTLCSKGHKAVVLWNKLIKRSVIKDIRFNDDLIVGEDLFFLYQVFQNAEIMVSHDIPLYYYVLSDSQCTWRSDFNYQGLKTILHIIDSDNCPVGFYSRLFVFASMLMHDIVLNGYDYSYNALRNIIISNKKNIGLSLKKDKDYKNFLKFRTICFSGQLYELLLKLRGNI